MLSLALLTLVLEVALQHDVDEALKRERSEETGESTQLLLQGVVVAGVLLRLTGPPLGLGLGLQWLKPAEASLREAGRVRVLERVPWWSSSV